MSGMRWWPKALTPWRQRALTAERNEAMVRRDLESALARYHAMLDAKVVAERELDRLRLAVALEQKEIQGSNGNGAAKRKKVKS